MVWYILFGFFAAFGLLSAIWTLLGFLLPAKCQCSLLLLCDPEEELAMLQRLLWLRDLGFLRCKICLSGRSLSEEQRQTLLQRYQNIEFYDPVDPED